MKSRSFLIGVVVFACLTPNSAFPILNGKVAQESDFSVRSTVSIMSRSSDPSEKKSEVDCAGTLIGQGLVITAAHCLKPFDAEYGSTRRDIKIVFGRDAHDQNASSARVWAFAFSKRYQEFHRGGWEKEGLGDIALLYFEGPTPKGYRPAEILKKQRKIKAGARVIVAGHGYHGEKEPDPESGTLRWAEHQTEDDFQLNETEIVAWPKDKAYVTARDAGGPAFLMEKGKPFLFGVARLRTDSEHVPGQVYTNVSSYHSWIEKTSQHLRNLNKQDLPKYRAWARGRVEELNKAFSLLRAQMKSETEFNKAIQNDRNLRELKSGLDCLQGTGCSEDSFYEYVPYQTSNEALYYISVKLMGGGK